MPHRVSLGRSVELSGGDPDQGEAESAEVSSLKVMPK
jgi:hypothetical protein